MAPSLHPGSFSPSEALPLSVFLVFMFPIVVIRAIFVVVAMGTGDHDLRRSLARAVIGKHRSKYRRKQKQGSQERRLVQIFDGLGEKPHDRADIYEI